jgi:hypothetical protein
MPKWFGIHDLRISRAIWRAWSSPCSVLFLREAVSWEGDRDILAFGAALALVVAFLTFFLRKMQ